MYYIRALVTWILNLCCRRALHSEPIDYVAMGLASEHLGEDGRRWILLTIIQPPMPDALVPKTIFSCLLLYGLRLPISR